MSYVLAILVCLLFIMYFALADTWLQRQMLTASDGAAGDYFGKSAAISQDYAIVGAPDDDNNGSNSGSVYIFKRNGTLWAEQQMLTASDGEPNDRFGWSVSISTNFNSYFAFTGAPYDDDKGSDSGSVYILGFCPSEDLNNDCKVDLSDFAIFAEEWLYGADFTSFADWWLYGTL